MHDMLRDRSRRLVEINRYYRGLHAALDESGTGPYRMTALGAWATSRAPHVYYFFRRIGLERYGLFLDLGSGDGIVTCVAGLFTKALGIEVDYDLCRVASQAALHLDLKERVQFICADYLTQRISKADCLYVYPDKPLRPIENLMRSHDTTLVVYGPHLPPGALETTHRLKCGRERLTLYRTPSQ